MSPLTLRAIDRCLHSAAPTRLPPVGAHDSTWTLIRQGIHKRHRQLWPCWCHGGAMVATAASGNAARLRWQPRSPGPLCGSTHLATLRPRHRGRRGRADGHHLPRWHSPCPTGEDTGLVGVCTHVVSPM